MTIMNVRLSLMSIVIYENSDQAWLSMKKIVPGLSSCYREFLSGQDSLFITNLSELSSENYSTVVSLDGKLEKLYLICENCTFGQLIIHIHGDFMDRLSDWMDFLESQIKENIKLVCSTTAQQRLIFNLMRYESYILPPFQLNDKKISLLKKDSYKFIYFGRISENKNIDWLIQYFDKFQRLTNRSDELIIRGPVDDIKCMLKDMSRIPTKLDAYLERLCAEAHGHIDLKFGQFPLSELDGSDFFISLSTYHDEDYGLAAFEAIEKNLIPILTNWGGYKSFNRACGVDGINVKLTTNGATLNVMSFTKQMLFFLNGLDLKVSSLEQDDLETIITGERFFTKENFIELKKADTFKNDIGITDFFSEVEALTYFKLYNSSYC